MTTRKTAGMEGKLPCRSTSLMGIKVCIIIIIIAVLHLTSLIPSDTQV